MIEELEPVIILGAPGGGTSYFTKFLRRCNFYAGNSIEEGRGDVKHIGWLGARKWHESVLISKTVNKPLMEAIRVNYDVLVDPEHGPLKYKEMYDHLSSISPDYWQTFIDDNIKSLRKLFNDEFPVRNVPYGWKDPRNVLFLPMYRMLFPKARFLTVERSINPDPTRMGGEGRNFTKHIGEEYFNRLFYSHGDDFRFQFEEFDNLDKVNKLLKWVGLETLTQGELKVVLKDTKFQFSKIGKA